jgi:hypothetical protein
MRIGDIELGRRRSDPVHKHEALFLGTGHRTGKSVVRHGLTRLMSGQDDCGHAFEKISTIRHRTLVLI